MCNIFNVKFNLLTMGKKEKKNNILFMKEYDIRYTDNIQVVAHLTPD